MQLSFLLLDQIWKNILTKAPKYLHVLSCSETPRISASRAPGPRVSAFIIVRDIGKTFEQSSLEPMSLFPKYTFTCFCHSKALAEFAEKPPKDLMSINNASSTNAPVTM